MKEMIENYSGKMSRKFWKRINKIEDELDQEEMYKLGVTLQNIEGHVLKRLKRLEGFNQTSDLDKRKSKAIAFLQSKFPQFLPISKYNNDEVILKENEIGMIYNCSVIFNLEYED